MKKKNFFMMAIVFLAFASSTMFVSCGDDDDDENEKTNYFMLGEMEGDLDKGHLEYYGMWEEGEGYNFDIILVSSSIDFDSETGVGDFAYFELFSESATELKPGTYTFNETYQAYTFDEGNFGIDFNIDSEENQDTGEMSNGSVEISKSGDTYTIEFSGIASGKTVKGHYSGTLMYYDWSSDMKSAKTKKWQLK